MPYFQDHYSQLRFPLATADAPGLRPAQLAAAHALSAHFFARKEPGIVVMPTGSGKTCVMLLAAFLLRSERILVVTPSRMVRDQIGAAFSSLHLLKEVGALATDVPTPKVATVPGRISRPSQWKALRNKDVVVATVQGVSPGIAGVALPPSDLFDLILCDEAHHTPAPSWQALLEHFREAHRALFTATPFRRDAKTLRGRIAFDYSLSRAREDGVFGQLVYEPVDPGTGDPDEALARAASRRFKSDRRAGRQHLLMIRTAQRSRAEELSKLYAKHTSLRLRTVLGSHSQKRLRSTVEDMRSGALDGVICVDMLGEGFDLPNLKIAVLHSPHKSLAVTLQFIGRFARTTGKNTGSATFLAVPSEIEMEAQRLYVAGAEWNEIVEEASRQRIESERELREVLATFEPVAGPDEALAATDDEIDLAAIAPYFHVKILDAPDGVDLERHLNVRGEGESILLRRSDDCHALVLITRQVSQCRWSRDERLADVSHALYILFFDELSKLFFICSSRRDVAVYDAIVASVALGDPRRLTPEEVNRVLRGVAQPSFFSVGMRNRSAFGNAESYRISTGPAADRTIQKTDGRYYDRGHCFGRGEVDGETVTIGFSSASKVWANQRGALPAFFAWCRDLGKKIADERAVETKSNLDFLPLGKRVTEFPEHLVAIDWHDEFYKRDGARLSSSNKANHAAWPLFDFALQIASRHADEVQFVIEGHGHSISVSYRLDRAPWFRSDEASTWRYLDADGRPEGTLLDLLNEYPPSLFAGDLSRLEGSTVTGAPPVDNAFDADNIEAVDWRAAGVDPLCEKPIRGKRSIFDWLQDRLLATDAQIIFNDDGAGEAADFVAIRIVDRHAQATFYHCKAAERHPVPGNRVSDLYEVTGQAVKCIRLTASSRLREHLLRRVSATSQGKARIVRGSVDKLRAILKDGVILKSTIVIVQPGVGAAPSGDLAELLAATNSYLVGAQLEPLRVIGSIRRK